MKRVVFLYTELAGYTMACLKAIPASSVRIDVVRYPVNQEAPFVFNLDSPVSLHNRSDFSDESLLQWLQTISPDLILVSGWTDKAYLAAAKIFAGKVPIVLLLDNPWVGSMRQIAGCVVGRFTIKPVFSHAWVPGPAQARFARNLGFRSDHIRTGFYCADQTLFEQCYEKSHPVKQSEFPHRLLYVGRYLDFKGINDLWEAFIRVSPDFPDWQLICAGTGELWENRKIHERIIHKGFVQPESMCELISETSWFILPSHKEPWGVVVQEMATAGMPMILSDRVAAGQVFLSEGENGFLFKAGDIADLELQLRRAMSLSHEQFISMQNTSRRLSGWVTTEKWVKTLLSLLDT